MTSWDCDTTKINKVDMDLLSEPFKLKCPTAYKNWTNGTTINKKKLNYSIDEWSTNISSSRWSFNVKKLSNFSIDLFHSPCKFDQPIFSLPRKKKWSENSLDTIFISQYIVRKKIMKKKKLALSKPQCVGWSGYDYFVIRHKDIKNYFFKQV